MSFAQAIANHQGRFPGCELSVISEGSYLTSVDGNSSHGGDQSTDGGRNYLNDEDNSSQHSGSTAGAGNTTNIVVVNPKHYQRENSLLGGNDESSEEEEDNNYTMNHNNNTNGRDDAVIIDVDTGAVAGEHGEVGIFRDSNTQPQQDTHHSLPNLDITSQQLNTKSRKALRKSSRRSRSSHPKHSYHHSSASSSKKRLRNTAAAMGSQKPDPPQQISDNDLMMMDDHAMPDLENAAVTTVSQHKEYNQDEYSLSSSDVDNPDNHNNNKDEDQELSLFFCSCLPTWMRRSPLWFQVSVLTGFILLVACTTIGLVAARLQEQNDATNLDDNDSNAMSYQEQLEDLAAAVPTSAPLARTYYG